MTTKSNYTIVTGLRVAEEKQTQNISHLFSRFEQVSGNYKKFWLAGRVVCACCNWSDNHILGFHTRDETAMLVYKTMEKCRSSFA